MKKSQLRKQPLIIHRSMLNPMSLANRLCLIIEGDRTRPTKPHLMIMTHRKLCSRMYKNISLISTVTKKGIGCQTMIWNKCRSKVSQRMRNMSASLLLNSSKSSSMNQDSIISTCLRNPVSALKSQAHPIHSFKKNPSQPPIISTSNWRTNRRG